MTNVLFPRGPGPLVSIMICSRGRPEYLKRAVWMAYELSSKQHPIEFVIKIDEDDLPTFQAVHFLADRIPCKFMIVHTPRGNGFEDMCEWVNRMSSKAEGDWLALLNDDSYMVSPCWDEAIYQVEVENPWCGIEDICLLLLSENDSPHSYSFPILRRKTYEILGHFAETIFCDRWIIRVMSSIGAFVRIPVVINHNRVPHEKDDTRAGVARAMNVFARGEYNDMKVLRAWQSDVGKLIDHMESVYNANSRTA